MLFENLRLETVILSVHGNKSKEQILKRTEQIGCQVFGTEQIRCFLKNPRLTEQVGYSGFLSLKGALICGYLIPQKIIRRWLKK